MIDLDKILEEAKLRYPVGTIADNRNLFADVKYTPGGVFTIVESSKFYKQGGDIMANVIDHITKGDGNYTLYRNNMWANGAINTELENALEIIYSD